MTPEQWEADYQRVFEEDLKRRMYAEEDAKHFAEAEDSGWDGDICPHCGSGFTVRIDIITTDPDVWHSECAGCGEFFEVLNG